MKKISLTCKSPLLSVLLILSLFVFPGFRNFGWAQTQTFTSNGTFTVPFGVTSITVECWGAGGGGSSVTFNGNRGGGGGGGGAYASSVVTVIPGNTYNVVVGNGGAASTAGGNSTFNATSVVAAGGSGGTNNAVNGGAGGTTAASTGAIKFAGGNGATGEGTAGGYSGGGGGGAGSSGNGGDASAPTAGIGTSVGGGNGATGVTGSTNGAAGSVNGGGGSGAVTNSATNRTGGAGAKGQVVVSWCPAAAISYAGTPFCGALATPQAVTLNGSTGGTFSAIPAGLTIDPFTGEITPATSTAGTYTVSYTIAAAGSCPDFITTTTLVIAPVIETPFFALGSTSSRFKGAGVVPFTATSNNSTGITYTLDAASIAAGNSIVAANGNVTFTAAWLGTSYITATATGCDGPKSSVHTVTTTLTPIYYAYISGNWDQASTWTFDPGGTTGPAGTIPGNSDRVVILTGRNVTLTSNVASTGLDITINQGGVLNQTTFRFTNTLTGLRGGGTLQLASAFFPTVTNNTFVTTDGGITEYNTSGAFDLPVAQTIYYHLTINGNTEIARQINNIVINGDLYVKKGTYQINHTTANRRQLTILGNVIVDTLASITTGIGNTITGADTPLTVVDGGAAPFLNYYNNETHRVIIQGNFTNNGTVRFTNQAAPKFDGFPNNGAATVYYQGNGDKLISCNGITDFYNLVVDKGTDQTFKLTVYSSSYSYFRLFGANNANNANSNTANPNVKKALWVRNGTLVLKGLVVIPSLTEGTTTSGVNTSHYYIPANGAIVLDGTGVIVLNTADDFTEVQAAYNLTGGSNVLYGINNGTGSVSGLSLMGRLQINDGYLSTRESVGFIYWIFAPGQLVLNNGILDCKQIGDASGGNTGLITYVQNGGTAYFRGRMQNTISYATPDDLSSPTINTTRNANGINGVAGVGTFHINTNAANGFLMSGGNISIYDAPGTTATSYALFIGSPASNINVTGGTIAMLPTTGSGTDVDFLVNTTAPFANFVVNRQSGTSAVILNTRPLRVIQNLDLQSGILNANLLDIAIGGNFSLAAGTTYTCTGASANRTIFNGTTVQNFTINHGAALSIHRLKIDKPVNSILTLNGAQSTLNVADSLQILNGTLNDNGKTINASGNILITGVHTGTGKIVMNNDAVRTIDGDGTGEFSNLEISKPNTGSSSVTVNSDLIINGTLSFSGHATGYKLLNIQGNSLLFTANATVTGASANRYIQTNGLHGDGGVIKTYTSTSPSFTFHVGAASSKHVGVPNYSPSTISIAGTATTYGRINVVPVGSEHPNTTFKNRSLSYYWKVTSEDFVLGTATVNQGFTYSQNDIPTEVGDITETGMVAARYLPSGYSWTKGTASDVDEATNVIGEPGSGTFLENVTFIDGDYTAGDDNATNPFGIPTIYYSRQSGLWGTLATWSLTSHTVDNPPLVAPGAADIVIIGGQDSVYLATNNTVINTDIRNCASLQIALGAVLDIGFNPGCSFGTVRSHTGGNGNFRLTTSWTSGFTYAFPAGDFSDFNINLGTTELYSTNPTAGTTYWLPNGVTSYGNLILSPLGGSNIIFPNNDLIIFGNLITRGQNADSWFCPAWDSNYPTAPTARVAKTITINGNLDIQGGALVWYGNAAIAQNVVVYGDVLVAPDAAIDVQSGATNQNMSIGGDLINNTVGTIAGGTTTIRQCDFTLLPLTFFGDSSSVISNTLNNPLTIFEKVTVNKGTSQATTLTLNIGGTLTTPTNNWLTLLNGTFKFMRVDPATDFTISTTTPFTIPSTAGFHVEYANAANRNILIANNAVNTNDLLLYGKLTIVNGNVYVGPTNGTTNNNNDIEYSSGGASTIDVRGGSLIVNGQIRRNASTAGGILNYNQQGGSVIINGRSPLVTNAKLEVLNEGSSFNMSSGTLTLIRGGGTTFGDLYLRPQTGSVTGGTIILAPGVNGAQTYQIDANLTLNNLTLSGSAGNIATASLKVSPLVLNGDLNISANSIFNTNSINTTFNGHFTNNGGTAAYLAGTNLTSFNAQNSSVYLGAQILTGATNFYNLIVAPGASLTLINSCNVLNNLTLSSGTMVMGSNLMELSGNFVNNGRYTDANTINTGIRLIGALKQQLSGNGIFGRLELNNAFGAQILNNISLEEDLVLTLGILDINKFLLSLGLQSNIQGAPFSATKMIKTDGVFSDVGVRKFLPAGPTASFLYPIGTAEKYTPATVSISANNTVGYIRVNNINKKHPVVIDPANALSYFWEVESSGITGMTGNMKFSYMQSDVSGVFESSYIAARLIVPGTSWSKTSTVDPGNNIITFNHNSTNNLGGEYTAGLGTAFPDDVPVYTSNTNGNWTDNTIWTQTGGSTYPCPVGGPNGFIVIIDHEVNVNSNYCASYRTTINNKLKIISPFYGHNLGTVDGNGTIYLESGSLPAGVYTSFLDCANNGTVEYGGSGNYSIVADLYDYIPNLLISGTGNRVLPNKNLTICKTLKINGPTLDNSLNNRKLTILGTMELISGSFNSGSGSNAIVTFAGTSAQTIGGTLGNFIGLNAFNNFEVDNSAGLSVNTGGAVEVKGNLLLTNGLIHTNPAAPFNHGTFTIINTDINCVVPIGGSSTSFINGPLIKRINQGDNFLFPVGIFKSGIGNITGDKLNLSSTKTGTILWTAEYRNPNTTFASFTSPLEGVSSKEYWNVTAAAGSKAIININWDPASDVTPLVTQNGLSDITIASYLTGPASWTRIVSTATGNNYYGTASTTGHTTSTGSNNYTLASLSILRPKAKLDPLGPVCGNAGIPVSFVHPFPIPFNYTLNYTINGIAQAPVTVSSVPYLLPTPVAGVYKLTGFTYNNGAGTGVTDASTITVNDVPTTADAGADQSQCGITSAFLDANPLGIAVGSGEWSIISGNGGTLISPTSRTSQFIGLNGISYQLRWTISNGTCVSTDDVFIHFTLLPSAPVAAANQSLCTGSLVSDIAVTPPPGSTVTWFDSPTGGTMLAGTQLLVPGNYYAESNGGSGCLSLTRTQVTVTLVDQFWAGTVNTDWNEAGNWTCGYVPTINTPVQIPNVPNKPVLSTGAIGTVQNILIQAGSSLTVTGNTLRIAGTITNNGTFTATSGTIEMCGTVNQTIGGGTFAADAILGLTVNNPAGVTLAGPLGVSGVVKASSGNLISGGNLTLLSTAAQTALIDGTGSGDITGNVTMQRYLPSGFGYKYFSSPFQSATVNEFADDLDMAASFPNLYSYNEDNHRDSSGVSIYTSGWVKYVTGTDLLIPQNGYAANFGNSAAAKTVDITGVVNNNILTSQTLYNHNRQYTKGFNLIGNPYPSPIDWDAALGWTKTNVDNAVYYFDAGITNQYTGTYSSYINGISSNGLAGSVIPSMQAFFVHVSNGAYPVSAALGMDNRVRVNNPAPIFHKSANDLQQPMIRLSASYDDGSQADAAVVYFNDFASGVFDQKFDALKLMNTDVSVPNLYLLTEDADRLSISALPYPVDSLTKITLGLKTMQSNWVKINATEIANIPDGLNVYLSDESTGILQDLEINPEYRIQLEPGTTENRFKLLFSKNELLSTFKDDNTFFANIANGKLNLYVKLESGDESSLVISNMLGQVMLKETLFGNGLHEIDHYFPAGMYILSLYSPQGICSHKIYIPK